MDNASQLQRVRDDLFFSESRTSEYTASPPCCGISAIPVRRSGNGTVVSTPLSSMGVQRIWGLRTKQKKPHDIYHKERNPCIPCRKSTRTCVVFTRPSMEKRKGLTCLRRTCDVAEPTFTKRPTSQQRTPPWCLQSCRGFPCAPCTAKRSPVAAEPIS